jgi:uncharacterized protein DUF3309
LARLLHPVVLPEQLQGPTHSSIVTATLRRAAMPISTILLIILILLLLGAVPAWPHSRSWGYGPTGGLGLVLLIVLILALLRVF